MSTMYDFLTDEVPDYEGYLPVDPQIVLGVSGGKEVNINRGRGRSEERIILSDTSKFWFRVRWNGLKPADQESLFAFYHDPNKACGTGRSFWFSAPTQYDSHTYVVRFDSDWNSFLSNYEIFQVAEMLLYVLVRKAE